MNEMTDITEFKISDLIIGTEENHNLGLKGKVVKLDRTFIYFTVLEDYKFLNYKNGEEAHTFIINNEAPYVHFVPELTTSRNRLAEIE